MLKSSASKRRNTQSGMAVFEIIPVLVIFALFCSYTYGFFTAIHSGILQSIASRNYAFETFRHRSNLTYFRSNKGTATVYNRYRESGVRYHAVVAEGSPNTNFYAAARNIAYVDRDRNIVNNSSAAEHYHNQEMQAQIQPGRRFNSSDGVNPIWLRIQYGICIHASCGVN